MKALTIGTRIVFLSPVGEQEGEVVEALGDQWKIRTDRNTIWRANLKTIISIQAKPSDDGKPEPTVNDPVPQNQAELPQGLGSCPPAATIEGHSADNGEPRGPIEEKGEPGYPQHALVRGAGGATAQLALI